MSLSKLKPTLCLLLLPYLAMSDRRPYKKCPSSFRHNDIMINCVTDFQGYCAFYNDGPYTRQKLTANECTACTDRSVKGYQAEGCTADRVYCDPRVRPEFCTKEYTSICAYTSENCNDDSCRKIGGNPCIACSDPNVIFYEKGECPQPTVNTCDNRPSECVTDEYNPVCGSFTEGCPYGTCFTTYTTPCGACLDSNVDTYTQGECDPTEEVRNCELIDIPAVCPEVYDPVCGAPRDCTGDNCAFTYDNACFACSNRVRLFKEGECPQPPPPSNTNTCDPRPDECVTDEYNPVCGVFTEGCPYGTCSTTYAAPCWACLDPRIETYTEGECDPSEEVRNCELIDIPAVCPAAYDPVCGGPSGCIGDECANTHGNACLACQSGVRLFKEGECPQ